MEGFGERLKRRAKELGLTDSEVARRLGMQQSRYSRYVLDAREPDLATLVKICRLLGTTPNALLGFGGEPKSTDSATLQRIAAAARAMTPEGREVAAAVLDTLAGQQLSGTSAAKKAGRKARHPRV
jgi:transcriptional regulator with XRE-family HTH domain